MSNRAWLSVTDNANTLDTRYAQELLQGRGYAVNPDGRFGVLTTRAVVAFQNSSGLTPDGNIGPVTWSVLEAKPKKDAPAKEAPTKKATAKKAPAKKATAKKAPAKKG